jgi:hypothetical protein
LTNFVNTLRGTHHHKSFTKARVIWTNIKSNRCWDICANFMHMVELVLTLLKAFDGKQLCMGRARLFMKILEQHVLSLWNPLFELPSNLANVIENQFY